MEKEWLLKLHKVSAAYGEIPVLSDVSLCIDEGEIVALMGPNGAGKSSVLRAVFGMLPHTGSIFFEGNKIFPKPHELVQMGIAFIPQGKLVLRNMTVEENLEVGGYYLKNREEISRRLKNIFTLFPLLHTKRKIKAEKLSGGQQQLLSIARGLMSEPKLLLLDEPTLGLSPKVVKEVFEKIKEINQKRKTAILIVEHNLKSVLEIVDRAYVLNHGKIIKEDTPENIISSGILEQIFTGKI